MNTMMRYTTIKRAFGYSVTHKCLILRRDFTKCVSATKNIRLIITCRGAINYDNHINCDDKRLQKLSASSSTWLTQAQPHTRGQSGGDWPRTTDEREWKAQRDEEKKEGWLNSLIFGPSNLWLIGDYTQCLCLRPRDLECEEDLSENHLTQQHKLPAGEKWTRSRCNGLKQ